MELKELYEACVGVVEGRGLVKALALELEGPSSGVVGLTWWGGGEKEWQRASNCCAYGIS